MLLNGASDPVREGKDKNFNNHSTADPSGRSSLRDERQQLKFLLVCVCLSNFVLIIIARHTVTVSSHSILNSATSGSLVEETISCLTSYNVNCKRSLTNSMNSPQTSMYLQKTFILSFSNNSLTIFFLLLASLIAIALRRSFLIIY